MQTYEQTFTKWLAFFGSPAETRQKVVDSLHKETKSGFDIITRISLDEVKRNIDDELFIKINELLPRLLAFSVFGGYMLYYMYHAIDPVEAKLNEKESISGIGKHWVEIQKNKQSNEYVKQIDKFMTMIIDRGKQARMNQFLLAFPEIVQQPYKAVNQVDKFLSWAGLQGYILAILEQKLVKGEEIVAELKEA